MIDNKPGHKQINDLDTRGAFIIERAIEEDRHVKDPTRLKLATNLGTIIASYPRAALNRGDLAKLALGTDNIKPSERLGRFQITPNKEPSASKIKFLSRQLHDYVKLVSTIALLTGDSREALLVKLFDGTKYLDSNASEDHEHSVEELLSVHLNRYTDFIAEACQLKKYFTGCRKYCAVARPTKIVGVEGGGREYKFEVEHDLWSDATFPQKNLFSIIHSSAKCFHKHVEEGEVPSNLEFIETEVFSLQTLDLAIYPVGDNNIPTLVFVSRPTTGILKNGRIFHHGIVPKEHGLWSSSPISTELQYKAWIDGINGRRKRPFKVDYQKYLDDTFNKPAPLPTDLVDVRDGHQLDLSWIKHEWSKDIFNSGEEKYFGGWSHNFEKKVDRVSSSSIRKYFSISRDMITTSSHSVFRDKYDSSRSISPPNTLMAELEINLWYDGFASTFDDSEQKRWAAMPEPNLLSQWRSLSFQDISKRAEEQLHRPTALEHLLLESELLSSGYFKWRRDIEKSTKAAAYDSIAKTEYMIKQLEETLSNGDLGS